MSVLIVLMLAWVFFVMRINRELRSENERLARELKKRPPIPTTKEVVWFVRVKDRNKVTTLSVPTETEADAVRYVLQQGINPRTILEVIRGQ